MSDFRRHLERQVEDDVFALEYEKQHAEYRLILFHDELIQHGVTKADAGTICICMEYLTDVLRRL